MKWLRVYKKIDPLAIKPHLLVYGDLTGACENCSHMDVKLDARHCFSCQTEFRYIAFRNIRSHFPKLEKITQANPSILIVDYDDYKRSAGASKAEDFFK
jgi:hypothetical protein